jgi:cytochrome c-type biogenesis protein CcmH
VNPVVLFMVGALALSVGVACVWWSVLKRAPVAAAQSSEGDPVGSNVAVYREHLAELEHEREQGVLSEQEYTRSRDELSRRLLEDAQVDAGAVSQTAAATSLSAEASASSARRRRWLAVGLSLYLPLAGLGLYGWLGQPLALDPVALSQGEPDHAVDPSKLTEMVAKLEQRLRDEPQQVEGWIMLARVQRARERLEESAQAYARALSLSASDDVAIERAEVLARARGSFEGEPWQIILGVLKADPEHEGARLLAGSAAFSEGRYALALTHWKRVQSRMAADAPDKAELDEAIAQAESRLGLPTGGPGQGLRAPGQADGSASAAASGGATSGRGPASASAARITGRVVLAPGLMSKVSPSDTVFIYATPTQGSRMPLAIVRTTVGQLPFNFVLDESSAMSPQASLAGQSQVTLRARISSTGDAMPKPGELGVLKTSVSVGATGVELKIEGLLP